jgi:ABC-type nitrate/sulfonate/bicarbonate transport system permease component
LLPLALALVLWQVFGNSGSVYYAPPSKWWSGIRPLWAHGVLARAIGDTLLTWVEAMLLAALVGTALGTLIGRSRVWDRMLGPFLEFLRVLPPSAIVPIVALMAGYTENMQLAVVLFGAVWPVLLSVRSSAQRIRQPTLDVGRAVRMTRLEVVRKLIFPSVVSGLIVGVRVAAPIALVVVILVEILTQVSGLGALMVVAQTNYDSAQLYGLVVIVGLIGLAAGWGVGYFANAAQRYWAH